MPTANRRVLDFIPFMTTGKDAEAMDRWFGTGPDREILRWNSSSAEILGLIVAALALLSRPYRH